MSRRNEERIGRETADKSQKTRKEFRIKKNPPYVLASSVSTRKIIYSSPKNNLSANHFNSFNFRPIAEINEFITSKKKLLVLKNSKISKLHSEQEKCKHEKDFQKNILTTIQSVPTLGSANSSTYISAQKAPKNTEREKLANQTTALEEKKKKELSRNSTNTRMGIVLSKSKNRPFTTQKLNAAYLQNMLLSSHSSKESISSQTSPLTICTFTRDKLSPNLPSLSKTQHSFKNKTQKSKSHHKLHSSSSAQNIGTFHHKKTVSNVISHATPFTSSSQVNSHLYNPSNLSSSLSNPNTIHPIHPQSQYAMSTHKISNSRLNRPIMHTARPTYHKP